MQSENVSFAAIAITSGEVTDLDEVEELMQSLTDSELMDLLQCCGPRSDAFSIAVDWFGESKLIELGLLD
jgi:hypothetical protein